MYICTVQYIIIITYTAESTAAYMKYCKPRKDGTCKLPMADYEDCREIFSIRDLQLAGVFIAFVYGINHDERRAVRLVCINDMYVGTGLVYIINDNVFVLLNVHMYVPLTTVHLQYKYCATYPYDTQLIGIISVRSTNTSDN